MNVKVTRVRRGDKVYQYAQLVESYRRDSDGRPTQRVIASLGRRTDEEIVALRTAFAALREGKAVVVGDGPSLQLERPVDANLAYLDVAVVHEVWKRWGLDRVLADVLGPSDRDVAGADVALALVAQRCIEPDSKLQAIEWFARSALPELLGIRPSQFNNTRIHRHLVALEAVETQLQERLALHLSRERGNFAVLFMDVTDTWFVGRGPQLAQRGKTKEGLQRKKVNILLVCDQDGLPLRWSVIEGRRNDRGPMTEMASALQGVPWAREVPLVVDRAMGQTAQLDDLLGTGLRFITALNRLEFPAYVDDKHFEWTARIDGLADDAESLARTLAENVGMKKVKDNLFIRDLGAVRRKQPQEAEASGTTAAEDDRCRTRLDLARQINGAIESGQHRTKAEAGRAVGLKPPQTSRVLRFLELSSELQDAVLAGDAAELTLGRLEQIARLPTAAAQREAFDDAVRNDRRRADGTRARPPGSSPGGRASSVQLQSPAQPQPTQTELRAVLAFNPEMFANQARLADELLAKIWTWTRSQNQRIQATTGRRPSHAALKERARTRLAKDNLVTAFVVHVDDHLIDERPTPQLRLELRDAEWRHRRRLDGFQVILSPCGGLQTAAELVQLYRAKDQVEKDFQTIKSVLNLRPVRHRTDHKVRAHVTICMLALLLERLLEQQLGGALTAKAALRTLADVHLNRLLVGKGHAPVHTVTRTRPEHDAIIEKLGLNELLDDSEMAGRITPR